MVRRVGFGDEETTRPAASDRAEAGSAAAPGKPGTAAKVIIVLLLLGWLAVWTWGIWYAFSAIAEVWGGMEGGAWDWGTLLFLGAWLVFALVGWAFGVVIVVVLLFGKPISEERRKEKQAMREARRRARAERRSRD